MREQLNLLIALQQADSEAVRIISRKKILPAELEKLEQTFGAFCNDVEKDQQVFDELMKTHRDREEKLKRGIESLKKAKERLLDVKTNKEYQAMLKEIEAFDLSNGAVEDEVLQLMDKLDQSRGHVKTREKELERIRRQYETDKRRIEEDLTVLDAEFATYHGKSLALKKQIPADLLKKYESIRNRNGGLAVIFAWKEVCGGCHMNIPPQMYLELQQERGMKYCPQCNRIIYWEDQDKKKDPE